MRCEDLAFGFASACFCKSGRIERVRAADSTIAAKPAENVSQISELPILPKAADYSPGTPIAIAPLEAFSAEKTHTSPPNAPTMNETAPYNSEMLMPSFVISPA